MKYSIDSKSHLTIRAGRRKQKGQGQGNGMSVTDAQLRAYRKAAKKTTCTKRSK